jgi:hypothetical protein
MADVRTQGMEPLWSDRRIAEAVGKCIAIHSRYWVYAPEIEVLMQEMAQEYEAKLKEQEIKWVKVVEYWEAASKNLEAKVKEQEAHAEQERKIALGLVGYWKEQAQGHDVLSDSDLWREVVREILVRVGKLERRVANMEGD